MRHTRVMTAVVLAAVTATTAGLAHAYAAKSRPITQYNLPAPGQPLNITVGSDGNLWFSMFNYVYPPTSDIGRLTPNGQFTGFNVPTPQAFPDAITLGPDGNVWFTELSAHQIASITPQGAVTEYPVPAVQTPSGPVEPDLGSLTAGPDGALWFTTGYPQPNLIGRMTTFGQVTYFTPPSPATSPGDLKAGPDGALWFTDGGTDTIGRVTTAGDFTSFPLPTGSTCPVGLTVGPDRNIWFTDFCNTAIGRLTLTGHVSEFPVASPSRPLFITTGHDGALWFTESGQNVAGLGRITTTGKFAEFSMPSPGNDTQGITPGPPSMPKTVWFTSPNTNDVDFISVH